MNVAKLYGHQYCTQYCAEVLLFVHVYTCPLARLRPWWSPSPISRCFEAWASLAGPTSSIAEPAPFISLSDERLKRVAARYGVSTAQVGNGKLRSRQFWSVSENLVKLWLMYWGFVNLPRRMSLFKLKQNGIEFLYSTHRAVDANAKVPMLQRTIVGLRQCSAIFCLDTVHDFYLQWQCKTQMQMNISLDLLLDLKLTCRRLSCAGRRKSEWCQSLPPVPRQSSWGQRDTEWTSNL